MIDLVNGEEGFFKIGKDREVGRVIYFDCSRGRGIKFR